jgi:serine/threonine protein kinase
VTAAPDRLAAALADRYRVERELGQGGMATVYLAEDLKHHRRVALKVLRPELAATLGPDRFFREIEVAAKLQHPHILPLHDSGEAGGFLYYVMPFVDGESLRGRLARGGELPIHDAVRILAEVADALAYAHGHGVVHRDIKPDNVLLSGRHALVTDFGVANGGPCDRSPGGYLRARLHGLRAGYRQAALHRSGVAGNPGCPHHATAGTGRRPAACRAGRPRRSDHEMLGQAPG